MNALVLFYTAKLSNFVAALDQKIETAAFWAHFASGFLGERSSLPSISSSFSSIITWRLLFSYPIPNPYF
jgi:hypothetical protein